MAVTGATLAQFASTTSSQLAGVISDETGSGSLVFATSPTLTTPTLGVATATSINKVTITAPATSATLTIANGKTATINNTLTFNGTDSSTIAFGAGGTVVYTSNKLSALSSTTSSELAGVISDETGSGVLVFGTSPTFTTSIDSGATFGAFASSTALTLGYTGAAASTLNVSTGAVANATTKVINIGTGGAANSITNINFGASSGTGTATFNNDVVVTGNLTVNGTTSTINSTTITVDDKNLELGSVASPTDVTADGGGITLKGATDKSFNWVNATTSWTSSENLELASGKVYRINGASVLSATALGTGITGSSLTSVGTLTSGTWNATTIGTAYGGTGLTSFTSGGAVYATSTSALTTGTLPATAGGTGQSSYAIGDLLYASTTTALSKLADVATGSALISGGVGVAPAWGKIGLTTHITGTLGIGNGGTGQTTQTAGFDALSPLTTLGDTLYDNGTNNVRLAGNTTTTKQFLSQTGNGTISAAPVWSTVSKTDVGLSAVENTALSSWPGTANVVSLGTVTTGTWNAGVINSTYGGTGINNGGRTLTISTGSLTVTSQAAGSSITLGGNINTANSVTTSGNFALTLTQTAATNVTLPTTGTLATLAGSEALSNKTISSSSINSTPIGASTASTGNFSTLSIGGVAITSTVAQLNFANTVTSNIQTQLDAKAPLASPALTGTPTAPTATGGTNTTQIATTEFVTSAISTAGTGKANLSGATFTGQVVFDAGLKTNDSDQFILGSDNDSNIRHTGSHLQIQNGTGDLRIDISSAGQIVYRDSANTVIDRFTFDIPTGNFTASGDVTSNSDARLKENVITIDSALDKVSNLRGVYFNKIGNVERKVGLIAQEVEAVIPEAVTEDANGIKSVAYANLVGLLIEALKDIKTELNTIKADINTLKSKE